jgi:hypothetical protein
VGLEVGNEVGVNVVGRGVGEWEGCGFGMCDGAEVGKGEGYIEGVAEGADVGSNDGLEVG